MKFKIAAALKSPITYILLAIFGVLFALSAGATTLEARQGGDWLKLHDLPCTNQQVLAQAEDLDKSKLRAAQAYLGGQLYAACYVILDDAVGVVYEDGDRGLVPMAYFTQVE